MAKPLPKSRLEAIVDAVGKRPQGATLVQIAASLEPLPAMRNVQRWVGALVRQKRIVREGSTNATVYKLPGAATEDHVFLASPEGEAIRRLVNQPFEQRAVADYRRVSLESYAPNHSWYVPADVRARLGAAVVAGAGAAPTKPWRDPAIRNQVVADFAWRFGWLEAQLSEQCRATLSRSEIDTFLAQPKPLNPRADLQLASNQSMALTIIVNRGANIAINRQWLTTVYGALTRQLQGKATGGQNGETDDGDSLHRMLRTESLGLRATTYHPSADPWVIEICFNQILGLADGITDPIEQAFFLFVHLLYLEPCRMLNASMACLAMNIALLRAGLPPVTFVGVADSDLLAGVRGVWELNRTELLRDVFVAACEGSRGRYGGVTAGKAETLKS